MSRLRVLLDGIGWANGDAARATATLRWAEDVTRELAQLRAELDATREQLAKLMELHGYGWSSHE